MLKREPGGADGSQARDKLVREALRLFAEKGFERATTREICEAAGANVSAIRYYFGDKAGLYRAAFTEPLSDLPCATDMRRYAALPLGDGLSLFFREFLEALKRGEELRLVMKLHFREMIEPTGAWQQEIDAEIKPQHETMLGMLLRHLKLPRVDDDLQRLAFAIIGMGVQFYVGQDVVGLISPTLLDSPTAVDLLAERLAGYAQSMIDGEALRRAAEAAA